MTNYYKGYDLSICQGNNVPFQTLADTGTKFIITKCAEGNKGIDPNYVKNIYGAKAAGLFVGLYHFIYPLPPLASQPGRDPIVQAQTHFKAVGDFDIPVHCIDAEWAAPQDWAKWGMGATQINDWCHTYLAEYTRLLGKKPVVYTYPFWARAVNFSSDIAEYPLWAASYQANNPAQIPPWGANDWVLWQNSGGTEHLPNGVPVDTDLAKDLSLWGIQDTPTNPSNSIPNIVSQPVAVPTQPVLQTPPTPAPEPAPLFPVQVAPSPARPPHPEPPIDGFLMMIVKFLKALLHI